MNGKYGSDERGQFKCGDCGDFALNSWQAAPCHWCGGWTCNWCYVREHGKDRCEWKQWLSNGEQKRHDDHKALD